MLKPNFTANLSHKNQRLLRQLQTDYADLQFKTGQYFSFHPPKTIILGPPQQNYGLLTLHELAHAILKHRDYTKDIQLIKIESAAWETAKQLSQKYRIAWDEDFVQDHLDSYRNWLHYRSLCPKCHITGYQDQCQSYHCPLCHRSWSPKFKPKP